MGDHLELAKVELPLELLKREMQIILKEHINN